MALTRMIDWVCDHWDQPEEGIWETRGGRKDFTYGRFLCWVALDRGIRLAGRHGPARQRQPLAGRTRHDLPADHEPGVEPGQGRLHPALRHRRPGLLPAAHAA